MYGPTQTVDGLQRESVDSSDMSSESTGTFSVEKLQNVGSSRPRTSSSTSPGSTAIDSAHLTSYSPDDHHRYSWSCSSDPQFEQPRKSCGIGPDGTPIPLEKPPPLTRTAVTKASSIRRFVSSFLPSNLAPSLEPGGGVLAKDESLVKEVKEYMSSVLVENERLKALSSRLEEQLRSELPALDVYSRTNSHCKELLKRNSDLEHLICDIQDEADGRIREIQEKLETAEKRGSMNDAQMLELQRQLVRLDEVREELDVQRRAAQESWNECERWRKVAEQEKSVGQTLESERIRLEETMNFHKNEAHRYRQSLESHLSSLGKSSIELSLLIRTNAQLETTLTEVREGASAEVQELQTARLEAEERAQALDLERGLSEKLAKERLAQVEALTERLDALSTSLGSWEVAKGELETQARSLQTTLEQKDGELKRMASELNRLKEKNRVYHDVHARCQQLLTENLSLREEMESLQGRLSHQSVYRGEAGLEIERLTTLVRNGQALLREAEARANVRGKEVAILEKSLQATKSKLQEAEAVISRPLDGRTGELVGCEVVRGAVEAATRAAKKDEKAHLERLTQKYEKLLEDVRRAQAGEMAGLMNDYERRTQQLLGEQAQRLEGLGREKMEELDAQWHSELEQVQARHSADIRRCCEDLERSMAEMQARKDEYWKEVLDREKIEADHARDAQDAELRDLRARLAGLKAESATEREQDQRLQLERLGEIQRLRLRVEFLEDASRKEAQTARERLEKAKQESTDWANEQLAELRRFQELSVQQEREAFQLERERLQNELDRQERLDSEREQRRDSTARNDEASGVDEVIQKATQSLADQVNQLKSALRDALNERDARIDGLQSAQMDLVQLQEELDVHKDLLDDKGRELSRLNEQLRLQKAQLVEAEAAAARLPQQEERANGCGSDPETFAFLLRRNKELEDAISNLSEEYHEESRKYVNTILERDATVSQLDSKIRRLQVRSRDESPSFPVVASSSVGQPAKAAGYESLLVPLRREKLNLQSELERERAKLRSVQAKLDAERGFSVRSNLVENLLKKLSDIDSNLRQFVTSNEQTANSTLEASELNADRRRLRIQIDYLETQVAESKTRIAELEANVANASSRNPNVDAENPASLAAMRALRVERTKLKEECRILEGRLGEQTTKLTDEIHKRKDQLKNLKSMSSRSVDLVTRNTELETQVRGLLDTLSEACNLKSGGDFRARLEPSSSTPADRHIFEILSEFQLEFRTKSKRFEEDCHQFDTLIEDRERTISKLQSELASLREELEGTFTRKMESMRLRYETDLALCKKDNEILREERRELEISLEGLKEEIGKTHRVDELKMEVMMQNLGEKIKDHQLLVAEIQDQRDSEVSRIQSLLDLSRAAHTSLQDEIKQVSVQLSQKDASIRELSASLSSFLTDVEFQLQLNTTKEETPASVATVHRLRGVFEELLTQLADSQQEANNLMQSLQTLLATQEAQLRETEDTRRNMANLLTTQPVVRHFNELSCVISKFKVEDLQEIRERGERPSNPFSGFLNLPDTAVLESNRRLISSLKTRGEATDREITELRSKLVALEGWGRDPFTFVTELKTAGQLAVESIKHGVESLSHDFGQLQTMRDRLVVVRRAKRAVTEIEDSTQEDNTLSRESTGEDSSVLVGYSTKSRRRVATEDMEEPAGGGVDSSSNEDNNNEP